MRKGVGGGGKGREGGGSNLQVHQQLWVLCCDVPHLHNLGPRAGLFQLRNLQPRLQLLLLLVAFGLLVIPTVVRITTRLRPSLLRVVATSDP